MGLRWDRVRFELDVEQIAGAYQAALEPRDLVDHANLTGAAIQLDGVAGDYANSGHCAQEGDFASAKRTIHGAFTAGNATGSTYPVLAKPGDYAEAIFTRNR